MQENPSIEKQLAKLKIEKSGLSTEEIDRLPIKEHLVYAFHKGVKYPIADEKVKEWMLE